MDKEIAKIICKECAIHKKDCTGGKANLPCLMAEFCGKALYNAGYRKLPKDSVVLSREEYEKLKSRADNKCRYDCDLIDMPDFEREKTLIEKTRKETAEKILKLVDNKLDLYRNGVIGGSLYDSGYQSAIYDIKRTIKELFNVEIKE